MTTAGNTSHRLLYLKIFGEGVLTRLHVARRLSHPKQKSGHIDLAHKVYGRVVKKLLDAFPNEAKDVDKLQGYDGLKANDSNIKRDLQPIYEALTAVVDFENALKDIGREVKALAVLSMEENPLVFENFLDCFGSFVQMLALASELVQLDAKAHVCLFAHVFRINQQKPRGDFPEVCQLLTDVEKHFGLKTLPQRFIEISDVLGEAVCSLAEQLPVLGMTNLVRQRNLLNVAASQNSITVPLPTETYTNHMLKAKMESWVMTCFLISPGSLARDGALDLLKLVLSDSFVCPVIRDVAVPIHDMFDYTFEKFDRKSGINLSKKKNRAFLESGAVSSVTTGITLRLERRTLITHEINNLVSILEDCPGLLGPKGELVICALSMARQELLWYFRHLKAPPPTTGKANKKFQSGSIEDAQIPKLIYGAVKLTMLVEKHKDIISSFHAEYLNGLDKRLLEERLQKHSGSLDRSVVVVLEEMIQTLGEIVPGSGSIDLEGLRLNIFSIQGLLSQPTLRNEAASKDLVPLLLSILSHSRLVDDIREVFHTHASIGEIFFFFGHMRRMLDFSLKGVDEQAAAAVSIVRVCSLVAYHLHPHCPIEHSLLGRDCPKAALSFMASIQHHLADGISTLFQQVVTLDVKEVNPAKNINTSKRREKVMSNVLPGYESEGSERLKNPIWGWAHNQNVLSIVIGEIAADPIVDVFSHRFQLLELIRAILESKVVSFLRSRVPEQGVITAPPIVRPSQLDAQLHAIARVLHHVCGATTLDWEAIIRKALMTEVYDPSIGVFGINSNQDSKDAPPPQQKKPVIEMLSEFMIHFLRNNNGKYAHSQWHDSFISLRTESDVFRAENFFSPLEIKSLVSVIGPYGVLHVDGALRKGIEADVIKLKQILTDNVSALETIKRRHNHSSLQGSQAQGGDKAQIFDCVTECKRLKEKGLTRLLALLKSIGEMASLRDMIFEKLGGVVDRHAPLHSAIASAMKEAYFDSASRLTNIKPAEYVIATAGKAQGDTDQLLLQDLSKYHKSTEDHREWGCLPAAAAAAMVVQDWKNKGRYDPNLGGHSNNAHCVGRGLSMLCGTFCGLASPGEPQLNPSGVSESESEALFEYVKIASFVVLTLKSRDSEKEYCTNDMIILLDKVMKGSRALQSIPMENILPYTLIREAYRARPNVQERESINEEPDAVVASA